MNLELKIESLEAEHLAHLINGTASTVLIRGLFSKDVALRLSELTRKIDAWGNYSGVDQRGHRTTTSTMCIGQPLNSIFRDLAGGSADAALSRYTEAAEQLRRRVEDECEPWKSPIQTLRDKIEHIWPWGVTHLETGDKPAAQGIFRLMCGVPSGTSEKPHIDRLPPFIATLEAQLSIICYIELPEEGGELRVWTTEDAVVTLATEGPSSLALLSDSSYTLRPEIGDVIILNTAFPHAIVQFNSGRRVTYNVFVGYIEDKPLCIWS